MTKKTPPEQEENQETSQENVPSVPDDALEIIANLNLDEKDPEALKSIIVAMSVSKTYSGPLPQSVDFARYEESSPGAGSRILNSMDKEQEHRHIIDKRMTDLAYLRAKSEIEEIKTGQKIGAFVTIILIAASVLVARMGYEWLGAIMIGTSALGVVHKFIDGRKYSNNTKKEED